MACYEFKGRHYVIVGATSGVGQSIAEKLASKGASLFLLGRDPSKLGLLSSKYDSKTSFLDLQGDDLEARLESLLGSYLSEQNISGFDGAVYSAGIAPLLALKGIDQLSLEKILRINYVGAILFSKLIMSKKYRHKDRGSSIVHIGSVSASRGEAALSGYCASKAALVASVKAIAKEVAPSHCRINCVSPGWLDTEMNSQNAELAPGLTAKMKALHPLGLGCSDDIASAVSFLLSDEARWITGTDMIVDGGFLA